MFGQIEKKKEKKKARTKKVKRNPLLKKACYPEKIVTQKKRVAEGKWKHKETEMQEKRK